MKKQSLIAYALASLIVQTAQAELVFESDCGQRVESFAYFVDYSGTMMLSPEEDAPKDRQKDEKSKAISQIDSIEDTKGLMTPEVFAKTPRIQSIKLLLKEINKRIKLTDYSSGLFANSPYVKLLPYGTYENQIFEDGIDKLKENMEVMGRRTPLGIGIEKLGEHLAKLKKNGVVYVITDGMVNRGRAVASIEEDEREADESRSERKDDQKKKSGETEMRIPAVDSFYEKNPDMWLSVISVANSQDGEKMIDAIVNKNARSIKVSLKKLLTDNNHLESFIANSFYKECQQILSIRGINFAFDKYNIDDKSEKILQEALVFINAQPKTKKFAIHGWTDWCGSIPYNDVLSLNRAKSVRNWLVNHGVEESRMTIKGMGKSFKYTNRTKEGRYQNRRIDFVFDE